MNDLGPDSSRPGHARAAGSLLEQVYDALRDLAAQRLAHEGQAQSLTATALVHEAYLRVVGPDPQREWDGRGHFFAAAAEAMRRVLIDRARMRQRLRRGGGLTRVDLNESCALTGPPDDDLLALDEALTRLAVLAPVKAEVVKLRYFAGLSVAEAAEALGISEVTAARYWAFARAWLYAELAETPGADSGEKLPPG
jgi:RNA polymerase sigma factor (TIGR02999 family)